MEYWNVGMMGLKKFGLLIIFDPFLNIPSFQYSNE
jgi:hypothetical protein